MKGCSGVIHVASPNPFSPTMKQLDIIYPAVEGMINVLQAALDCGVQKVVITSCICALRGAEYSQNYNEENWPDPNKMTPIERSKLLAERTAWHFYKENNSKIGITSILPGFLIGPSLSRQYNKSSARVICDIANGKVSRLMKIHLSSCDVRDAAEAHIKALWSKKTNGKRYVCVENSHWLREIVQEINEKFSPTPDNVDSVLFKPLNEVSKIELLLNVIIDKNFRTLMPFYNKEVYF